MRWCLLTSRVLLLRPAVRIICVVLVVRLCLFLLLLEVLGIPFITERFLVVVIVKAVVFDIVVASEIVST